MKQDRMRLLLSALTKVLLGIVLIGAVLPMLLYIPIIAIRIKDEEQLLHSDLAGYTGYCDRVRWRLFPLIW